MSVGKLKEIMLVESSMNQQALYKIMLAKSFNCNITIVNNELEAILNLQNKSYDIIIIGTSLPFDSSSDLIKCLKTTPNLSQIPILKISGTLTQKELLHYINLKIDDILLVSDFQFSVFIKKTQNLLCKPEIGKQAQPKISTSKPEKEIPEKEKPVTSEKTITTKPSTAINKEETAANDFLKNATVLISDSYFEKKLAKIAGIKPLPFIVTELVSMTASINSDIKDLAKLIETDYALTSRILKLANSAFYKRGTSVRIHTLGDAIRTVGFFGVKDLALAISTISTISSAEEDLERIKLWYYAFNIGVVAKEIAYLIKHPKPEGCFIIGLMQDLGFAVLKDHFDKEFKEIIQAHKTYKLPLNKIERKLIGYTHNEISSKILDIWNFPKAITIPILFSHLNFQELSKIEENYASYKQDIMLLKLSSYIANIISGPLYDTEIIEDIPNSLLVHPQIKINSTQLLECISGIKEVARELMQIMLLHIDPEVIAKNDYLYRFNNNFAYKCLLIEQATTELSAIRVILKEIGISVKSIKSEIYEKEIIKKEKTNILLLNLNNISKEVYTPEYVSNLYEEVNPDNSICFCILTTKNIIEDYKSRLNNPENYLFLTKPFNQIDIITFLENTFKYLRQRNP